MDSMQNEGAGAESQVDSASQTTSLQDSYDREDLGGDEKQTKPDKQEQPVDLKALQKQLRQQERRIGRLTAERYQSRAELDDLRKFKTEYDKKNTAQKNAKPTADQFQSFDEYVEAVARWAATPNQEQQDPNAPAPSGAEPPAQEKAYLENREAVAIQQVHQLSPHIPDFTEVISDAADLVDALPWQNRKALYDSPHPALAAYILQKEGLLLNLFDMNPQQVAMVVQQAANAGIQHVQAILKGKQQGQGQGQNQNQNLQTRQHTNAPAPLSQPKGSTAGKSDDSLSGAELKKKYGI